jgi:hypothetical protein
MSRDTFRKTASGGAAVIFDDDDDDDDDDHGQGVGGYGAGHQLRVLGYGLIVQPKRSNFVALEDVICAADIDSLHAALLDTRRCCRQLPASPELINVALDTREQFHALSSPIDSIYLRVDVEKVSAVVQTVTRRKPVWTIAELMQLLAPAVTEHDCEVSKITYRSEVGDPDDWDGPELSDVEVQEWRNRADQEPHDISIRVAASGPSTVRALLAAGRDVAAIVEAYRSGTVTLSTARNLVRGGRPHLLKGLEESDWLEVKSQAYRLAASAPVGERQKVELAQDVARFANGEVDGLIVLGFKESKSGSNSVIGAVSPIPLADLDIERYRSVIDQRVVPLLDGLLIENVELSPGWGMMVISVPAQRKDMQPFLVHGAIVGDKMEGAFISIVRRRGEGSAVVSAREIHAYIVAGRKHLLGD